MSNIALQVVNLSKKYKRGIENRSSFPNIKTLFQREKKEEFYALQDINFEIQKGETIGIIGGNGAGKSTLLKLISKITYPTTGQIMIDGKVSSMLEVGTGFHQELTGRENIYLSGSLLGMKKNEISKQLDSIIDFSGIHQFIDTELKHYSSGMYVRLGFAVASHLKSDIILLDEILAVGDAEFQKKSIEKIEEIKNSGHTILLVSHNMNTISDICNRTMLFDHGELLNFDKTEVVINQYTNRVVEFTGTEFLGHKSKLENIIINGTPISQNNQIDPSHDTDISIIFSKDFDEEILIYLGFRREGRRVFTLSDHQYHLNNDIKFKVPKSILRQGKYLLDICFINKKGDGFYKDEIATIDVLENSSNLHLRNNLGLINLDMK